MAGVASHQLDGANGKRSVPADVEDIYGLSPTQQGMLLHTVWDPDADLFFQQLVLRLEDPDVSALLSAWQRVVDRHPVLRSSFHWEGLKTPVQVVHRRVQLPVEKLDWRGLARPAQEQRLRAFLRADRRRGFRPTEAPLLRLTLLRLDDRRYTCVKSNHHVLLDAWSGATVLKEVHAIYQALRQGRQAALPEPVPYRDYVAWLQRQDLGAAEAFWRAELAGFTDPTPLPGERPPGPAPRPAVRFLSHRVTVSGTSTTALHALAQRLQITLSTLVQGAWAVLLSSWSGQDDVVFGATVSGRPAELEGVESMVGLFINALPVRVRVNPDQAVEPWLQALHARTQETQRHQHSPPAQLQSWSEVARGLPLFETLVTFNSQSISWGTSRQRQPDRIPVERAAAREPSRPDPTNQPLSLIVVEAGDGLFLDVTADASRFEPGTPIRLLEQLRAVLEQFATGGDRRVGDLSMMTPAESQQVVHDWNRTRTDHPRHLCLHDLFEATARRSPDATAVLMEGRALSYGELNRRANRLARFLRERGVGPDVLVGLALERSPEMAVAVLAILKAGGGYVPLDPDYPPARLALMLEDSRAALVLSQETFAGALADFVVPKVFLDTDADRWRDHPVEDLEPAAGPENLAFVIYTSGSTGTPKGVAVPHRVCVSRVHVEADPFRPGEVLPAKTSLNFIDSVWELFGAWTHGLPVALIPADRLRDATALIEALADAHATRIVLVPSLLRMLVESGEPLAERLPRLEHWISSGEPLPRDLSERFAGQLPGAVLTNLYGTSETWDATRCDSRQRRAQDGLPIGRPIDNCTVYALGCRMRPVPVGVPGELYVGGEMLARGYHRRPGLTAERFLPDPFSTTPGARLYRTGDRVRWLPDGHLESVGRIDHQLKVRGYRIEPSEIEVALRRYPAVRQAVVTATAQQQLVAHIIHDGEAAPEQHELREFVRTQLPEHMVPVSFIPLKALPLTPSGKVDRRALQGRDPTPQRRGRYVAPRTPEEATVAAVWSEVLGVGRVGVEDDFFDLGGHSLLATQMLARLRSKLQVNVPIEVVFGSPTVASLVAWIEANQTSASIDAAPPLLAAGPSADGGREAPQSFAQQRMWFLAQLAPGSALYNTLAAVPLQGRLDIGALQRTVDALVERHETLRTTFGTASDGELIQIVSPPAPVHLAEADLSGLPAGRRQAELQRLRHTLNAQPFDLARGPLVRFTLVRIQPQRHALAWSMHHIVTDGWSIGVMHREVLALYEAFRAGRSSPLPDLPLQYADFATWQREWLQGEELADQLAYWTDALRGAPQLELPTDRPRPATPRYASARVPFRIDREVADGLSELARLHEATRFMVLLAAFQFLLSRYGGQDDVVVGTPIANRTRTELEGVVGFFVNTLVMRTRIAGAATFTELLSRVRRSCLEAYAHQDLPFEKLVEELAPQRDLGVQPLVQVLFVLQNTPQAAGAASPGPPLDAAGLIYFDLTLSLTETPDALAGELHYNTDLFERGTAERMVRQLETLLRAVAERPHAPLSAASMISEGERTRLVQRVASVTPGGCVHQLVQDRAARAPNRVAVVCGTTRLSYRELDRRANGLAHRLRSLGVRPEITVGAFLERGADAVVALLAILKAGGVYLPLDPGLPAERLAWQLADAEAEVILAQRTLRPGLPGSDAVVLCMDDPAHGGAGPERGPAGVAPDHAAYLIYTSGTTGHPKGVVLEHRGLFHTIRAQVPLFGLTPDSRVLATIAPGFDASLGEILRALAAGATLYLAEREAVLPGPDLLELLRSKRITTVTLSTSVVAALPVSPELPDLETLTVGGETLPADVAARWQAGRRLINGYGPTETTIGATLASGWDPDRRPPIGRPLPHVRARVLDAAMQLVPEGVPGELFLGGPGVARGYRGRPGLTAERFLPDPFSAEPGARLYRTGDRVRWLPDGQLDFLGRVDRQVKVRGHRVEPEEVAAVLRTHRRVRDAAVVALPGPTGDQRLVAYVVPAPEAEGDGTTADGLVEEWERASEQAAVAVRAAKLSDPALNFSGWTSSYTGRPIPTAQMREWADSTVERILQLDPHEVMEIGSGTGLILFRLAPHCRRYVGIDFSAGLLEHTRRHLERLDGTGCDVELHQRRADALDDWPSGSFDCVVLNSVVQYFPDVNYLLRVLDGAVRLVRANGHVFIGDVRNLRLLGALHASVQLSRAAATVPAGQLAQRVQRHRSLERELVLEPELFAQLMRTSERVTHVRVLPKAGTERSELSAFRYDVTLEIEGGGPVEPTAAWSPWRWESTEAGLRDLRAALAGEPAELGLRGVPNARTTADARLAAWLEGGRASGTAAELRQELARIDEGVEPEALVALGRQLGYAVELSWLRCDAEGRYDAHLARCEHGAPVTFAGEPFAWRPWREYANSPVEAAGSRNLQADLREHVVERLPDYMVPSAFVTLAALPLTAHGKLDDGALPAPEGDTDRPEATGHYVAPRTPAEKLLAGIWADLLRLERVGVHDNFFELGGDSILSIRVIARANQTGLNLTTQDVYRLQTVAEQAAATESADAVVAEQEVVTGDVPLTPIQRWFFDADPPEPHHCNWATFLPVPPGMSGEDVRHALATLLEHHDALRLRFVRSASGAWRQFLADVGGELPLTIHDVSRVPRPERRKAIGATVAGLQPTLNLSDGPLLRLARFDAGEDGPAHVALIVHHLVVDTVSWPTLVGDLTTVLRQLHGGRPIALPAKTSSFKDWAEHLLEYASSGAADDERRYWVDALRQQPAALPLDHPGGENSRASARDLVVSVEEDDTRHLKHFARASQSAVDEVLLTALGLALARWTGERRAQVNVERHGRHDLGAGLNLSRTVGWFACIVPVALDVALDAPPREVLDAVRRRWRAMPNRGIGYGVLRYLAEGAVRAELERLPDAEIFFCYHGERRAAGDGTTARPAGRPLSVGPLQSSAGTRRHVIEINAAIEHERLGVRWSYSANLHERATIAALAEELTAALREVLAPDAPPDVRAMSGRDFPGVDLADDELATLLGQLD